MYERLLNADLVVADLSTSNPNALFELGVRYGLKPKTTVVMAEEQFKNPFDTNHISFFFYRHHGESLDIDVVEDARPKLKEKIEAVYREGKTDSPVYTLIPGLQSPQASDDARATARGDVAISRDTGESEESELLIGDLLSRAERLRESGDFEGMKKLLLGIKLVQGERVDDFVVQQLALATYKAETPCGHEALRNVALFRDTALSRLTQTIEERRRMLAHPNTLAAFNAWANRRLYAACADLTAAQIAEDRGAFFQSILGTLNHILLVDILYRERLEGVRSRFKTLDEILHTDFERLSAHQAEEDARWIALTKEIDPETLDEPIGFWTLLDNPDRWEVPKHIYFTNLCQHQAHHRGQAHNMVSQTGIEPPPIGYIEFRIDTDGSFVTTPADG